MTNMDEQNRVEDIDRVDGGSTSEQNLEQEKAMMTTLAGLIVVLTMLITQISTLFDTIKSVFGL